MTTVSTLPAPPLPTDSPSVFNSKAFATLAAQVGLVGEINTVAGEINTAAAATAVNAAAAQVAQVAAVASATAAAQSAGAVAWVSGAAYALGACVWSPATRFVYRRLVAGAGITDPSADPINWGLAAAGSKVLTVSNLAAIALSVSQLDATRFAGVCTWTLPGSPTPGDRVGVKAANGRKDNVIARNGKPIEGLAENMTVDQVGAAVHLVFIDNTYGWGIE